MRTLLKLATQKVWTVGAKDHYDIDAPVYKSPGGTVWKKKEQARPHADTIEADGEPREGSVYPVELPGPWDEHVEEANDRGRGELKTKAKVLT